MFDPSPFNVLSPWKYNSNMSFLGGQVNDFQNMSQFTIKTPRNFKHSPMKSPFKPTGSWLLSSPFVGQEKENLYDQ
jgi:hypothetical protein